jgi:hypothetical protein
MNSAEVDSAIMKNGHKREQNDMVFSSSFYALKGLHKAAQGK